MPRETIDFTRYARQLALPEVTTAKQEKLARSHIVMVGAGGLGSAALPALAGAGIGRITIMDDDRVDISNLHRQTIYRDEQDGQNKAECAATYLQALNPDCNVQTVTKRAEEDTQDQIPGCDLLIDGSDNFETKTFLNTLAIERKTPFLSASVNRFEAQVGLFAGHAKEQPCYACLFPTLPKDARNCNEAGILGTAAGLTGTYQAHMALCFLLGLDNIDAGSILSFDFKSFRVQHLKLRKDANCPKCKHATEEWNSKAMDEENIEIIAPKDLASRDHIVIDVRTDEEVANDPIDGATHIELQTIPARFNELPEDTLLAFACASNVRSMQAAEFMRTMGYDNVCVYDRLVDKS